MSSQVETVISPGKDREELPSWITEYAVMVTVLGRIGILQTIAGMHIRRQDGYSLIDAFMVFMAYFCNGGSSLRAFLRQCQQMKWGAKLAAMGGRERWPSSSSVSRMLKCLRKKDIAGIRDVLAKAVEKARIPTHPLGQFIDALGQSWLVFDLDGVVKAFRNRALPEGRDLPPAVRRTEETAKPGYPGRKRGEVQISASRLQQAGTGLWVGQETSPGNSHMAEAVTEACTWLKKWCEATGLDPARVILRMDGAAGNAPCAEAVKRANFRLVTRNSSYGLLEVEEVKTYLNGDVFHEVPSSLTGPTRHAAELGTMKSASELELRTVVSRFPSREEGKKSGSGHVIGKAQYEMYTTSLAPEAWPAEDLVALYYGRSATENHYGAANKEFKLHRTFSMNRAGQDFAIHVGMLLSNLQTEFGAMLLKSGNEKVAPATPRGERLPTRFADFPIAEPLPVPPMEESVAKIPTPFEEETNAMPPTAPLMERVAQDIPPHFSKLGFRVDQAVGVFCPDERLLRLHRNVPLADGNSRVSFRATASACAVCPTRSVCTDSTSREFLKEVTFKVRGHGGTPPRPPPTIVVPQRKQVASRPEKLDVRQEQPKTGQFQCRHPLLVSVALRRLFLGACEKVIVNIEVDPSARERLKLVPHLALDAAQRQHRRHTRTQRLDWNAPAENRAVSIRYAGGDLLGALINSTQRAA